MEAISDFADFVRCHEPAFLHMMAMKNKAIRKAEFKKMQETVEYGNRRLEELERLMDKLYEDNILSEDCQMMFTTDEFQNMKENKKSLQLLYPRRKRF